VPHAFETAPSGRAKCRGCGEAIVKGELRFGERMPNLFGEGEMTLWFHVRCGAFTRPEPFLAALADTGVKLEDEDRLESVARLGIAHRRLPRIRAAERSASGRARCRSCRKAIPKGEWRIALVYFEDARFEPSGFVHLSCSKAYFESTDILDRIRHFSRLSDSELAEIGSELARSA
jgi:hypothetical protein